MTDMLRVQITEASQPHRLRHFLTEAGVKHGATADMLLQNVVVDEPYSVRQPVSRHAQVATLRFCPMNGARVLRVVEEGDGGEIPEGLAVTLAESLYVKRTGHQNMVVRVHTNGTMALYHIPDAKQLIQTALAVPA